MTGRKPHSIADHAGGIDADHVHAPGGDHDHEHGEFDAAHRHDPVSIGVDVGSTTTQVVFSRLALDHGEGGRHAARAEILHRAPACFTPFAGAAIDVAALDAIIDGAFAAARLTPDDVDTGAVIMTGATLERANARAVADAVAARVGDVVAIAAGDRQEAMLAAYGAGAVARSAREGSVLNVDIGGATTKLALCVRGAIAAVAVLGLGARALVEAEGRVARTEPALAHLIEVAGAPPPDGTITARDRARLGDAFADILSAAMFAPDLVSRDAWRVPPPDDWRRAGAAGRITISGGVGEYLRDPATPWFGDLGQAIGAALRDRAASLPLGPAAECLRATALGAAVFTVQGSGATSYISHPARLLPRRDLAVARVAAAFEGPFTPATVARAIANRLELLDANDDVALAIAWSGEPSHARLAALADGIIDGLRDRIAAGRPIHLFIDGDVARTLGAILVAERGVNVPLLVLDGVTLWDLDHVDIGRLRLPRGIVPVTVKSLVFADDPRGVSAA